MSAISVINKSLTTDCFNGRVNRVTLEWAERGRESRTRRMKVVKQDDSKDVSVSEDASKGEKVVVRKQEIYTDRER